MESLTQKIKIAGRRVAPTLRKGDPAKWAAYQRLTNYEQRLKWRKAVGHAEYCRLSRLAFHGFL